MFKKTKKYLAIGLMGLTLSSGIALVQPTTVKACSSHGNANIGYYPGYVMSIGRGSYDFNVQKFQSVLHNLYVSSHNSNYDIDIDGYFGYRTQKAVLYYQDKHGLQRDGQVGRATWSSMQNHR